MKRKREIEPKIEEENVNESNEDNTNQDKCLDSPKITEVCKQLYRRLNEDQELLKEFIHRKCSEKSISTFVKIQQELHKMIKEKRLCIQNFTQVGVQRISKNDINEDTKFTLKVSLRGEKTRDIINVSKLVHDCNEYGDFEYYAFFKQVNSMIVLKSDELFNKIQSKEIKRLVAQVHDMLDPTQANFNIRYLNQLDIVAGEGLLSDMLDSDNELFLEWVERKSLMFEDIDYLKAFKSEQEKMVEDKKLFIPIYASILRIRNNRKNEDFLNQCICKIITVNGKKVDLNKKVTITMELDKFGIYNLMKPCHDQIVNSLEGIADDDYLVELNRLYEKVIEVIENEDDK